MLHSLRTGKLTSEWRTSPSGLPYLAIPKGDWAGCHELAVYLIHNCGWQCRRECIGSCDFLVSLQLRQAEVELWLDDAATVCLVAKNKVAAKWLRNWLTKESITPTTLDAIPGPSFPQESLSTSAQ